MRELMLKEIEGNNDISDCVIRFEEAALEIISS